MAVHLKNSKAKKIDKKKRREELEERFKPSGDEYEGFIESGEDSDREMTYARRERKQVQRDWRRAKIQIIIWSKV